MVEKKRRKKKGRPSLLDLQKRSLKQQKHLLKKHNKNLQINNNNNNNIDNNSDTINSDTNIINKNSDNITPEKSSQSPPPQKTPKSRRKPNGSSNLSAEAVVRRSTRRNPNPNYDEDRGKNKKGKKRKGRKRRKPNSDEEEEEDEEEELEEEIEEREVSENVNDDNAPEEIEGDKSVRKRKIESISGGSAVDVAIDHDKGDKVEIQNIDTTNQTSVEQGRNKKDDGTSTPIPDKKLLLFILDRLQKKDSYGVFSEPVDPEELPDYHEIIEHPMDFTTVRKKLEDGSYGFLEEFEKDIFLICSNAMQYNGSDTVYFRQACSIQELAKKSFENLRQDSDDNELDREPKVVRRGRPPKNLKRPGRPPLVRANSDFSEATLATSGGPTNRSTSELRKGSPLLDKYGSTDSVTRALLSSRNSEAYMGRLTERFDRSDNMIGSPSKGISMKHGKRQIVIDESRRNTYQHPYDLARHEPSVLTTFHGERKQLIAVGLHSQYGYARSLAQFAAKLGPIAWKVASRKIERCLPSSVKFGQGWVGEKQAPSEKALQVLSTTPVKIPASANSSSAPTHGLVDSGGDTSAQKPLPNQLSEVHMAAVPTSVPSASVLNNGAGSTLISPETSQTSAENLVSTSAGPIKSENSVQIHQSPAILRVNGVNGSYGLNLAAQVGKMIGSARPSINFQPNTSIVTATRIDPQSSSLPSTDNNDCGDEAKLPANSRTIKSVDGSSNGVPEQKVASNPPDLNVGFQSLGSPGSGKADLVQPDLALQL